MAESESTTQEKNHQQKDEQHVSIYREDVRKLIALLLSSFGCLWIGLYPKSFLQLLNINPFPNVVDALRLLMMLCVALFVIGASMKLQELIDARERSNIHQGRRESNSLVGFLTKYVRRGEDESTQAGMQTANTGIRGKPSNLGDESIEYRRSQWQRPREDDLRWENLSDGYVRIGQKDDGWRCWINRSQTDCGAGQYCVQHATFDMALATAYLWMECRLLPQSSMDGHPFVPLSNGKPVEEVTPDYTVYYLDDHSDVGSLLGILEKQEESKTLREQVGVRDR